MAGMNYRRPKGLAREAHHQRHAHRRGMDHCFVRARVDIEEILRNYPQLSREDILACVRYAEEIVRSEKVYPLPPS